MAIEGSITSGLAIVLGCLLAGCGGDSARLERKNEASCNARGPAVFEPDDIEMEAVGRFAGARDIRLELEDGRMQFRVDLRVCDLERSQTFQIVDADASGESCTVALGYSEDPDTQSGLLTFDRLAWSAKLGSVRVEPNDEGAVLTVTAAMSAGASAVWFGSPQGTDAEGSFDLTGTIELDQREPEGDD